MAGLGDTSPPAGRPGTTTIHSLGEDLLLDVFLRLPSLAALVRAALACRAWRRAVASSPAFRRRFRALHPPPLLGLFFQAPPPAQAPNLPAIPSFAPTRPRDADMAAAVRRGDFFFTSLQCRPGGELLCWDAIDSCGGHVLLQNWDEELLLVLNPLTSRGGYTINLCSFDSFAGSRGRRHPSELNGRLLCPGNDPALSFSVVILAVDDSRLRANVFSSETGEWSVLPWVAVPEPVWPDQNSNCWLQDQSGMQANGVLYWVYKDQRYLVSLDTATMGFSVAELPQCLRDCSFEIGETKDGATCIVYSDMLDVGVLMLTRGDDGVESWALDRVVSMDGELRRVLRAGLYKGNTLICLVDDPSELSVLAVRDGYAYLATSAMYTEPQPPCWFLSLCLETMKFERLFRRTFDSSAVPYVMAWPPSLVGNCGRFALEDAQ